MSLGLFSAPILQNIPGLKHGFSSREGGVSVGPYRSLNFGWDTGDEDESVEENYRRLAEDLGSVPEKIYGVAQVHGREVVRLETSPDSNPRMTMQADSLMTSLPRTFVSVRVADCVPILLADPVTKAVAAVHAGWRGTLAGVLENTLSMMMEECGSEVSDIRIAAGPAIGKCCFDVDFGVAALFQNKLGLSKDEVVHEGEKSRLDLVAINLRRAQALGVRSQNVWTAALCTRCHPDLFFSYRRDGRKTGRCAGVIGWAA